uniref:KOW domain-containing protein n=1 Tax=Polytomella parva TaxID=51329 RepID=A0A7S0VP55_9CHLO|mmetsp:Transcript_8342/g.16051  ORF Transcript_8342/g.16051 Transcript_8342/m.16051 type:complete len:186 (+) Transcript_8342:47-604(+)
MLGESFRLIRKAKAAIKPVDVHIFREDVVKILSGPDKGLTGKVLEVFPEADRLPPQIFVEGRNLRKKKIRIGSGEDDYIVVSMEAPLPYQEVQLVDPKTFNPIETMWMYTSEGQKVRVKKMESPTSADIIPIAVQDDGKKNEGLVGCKDTPYDIVQKVTYNDPSHNLFPLSVRGLIELREKMMNK